MVELRGVANIVNVNVRGGIHRLPALTPLSDSLELRVLRLYRASCISRCLIQLCVRVFAKKVGVGRKYCPVLFCKEIPLVLCSIHDRLFKLLLPLLHIVFVERGRVLIETSLACCRLVLLSEI